VTGTVEPLPTTTWRYIGCGEREERIPASEERWAVAPLSMTHSWRGCCSVMVLK
jgi:hypothetical protein